MRRPLLLTVIVATVLSGAVLAVAWRALRPGGPPLVMAAFSQPSITPNGDGSDDLTQISYTLRRPAAISIYFVEAGGARRYFRQDKPRDAGSYSIEFGGVVDGYTLPGEDLAGQVLTRVLQDGDYTWVIEARDSAGQANQVTGSLTVSQADTALPILANFTVSPTTFSPNQDGIDDRATLNLALEKDVPEDGLQVFLIGPDGTQLPVPEQPSERKPGQAGLHTFDYDAGIDQGLNPPPAGSYTARATVVDRIGQRVVSEAKLDIVNSGLPRAEIHLGQVDFSATSLLRGETLRFRLVVDNYGTAPLRTSGPPSGWVYESMSTNANALGEYEQSGAWRVGIHCQTCKNDYPWRWALGTPQTLTLIPDSNGNSQYYLMPGESAVVEGGVVLDEIVPSLNPQYFWAGLIHENVEVTNNRVDPDLITIIEP